MNIRLLKINTMKRFHDWATMTGDHGTVIDFFWIMSVKQIEEVMDRQKRIHDRNSWFIKRKNAIVSYQRAGIADSLLKYIKERKTR